MVVVHSKLIGTKQMVKAKERWCDGVHVQVYVHVRTYKYLNTLGKNANALVFKIE